ncbi:mini-chromosome maintenance complex-binding protein-like [Ylistrum balloti]|uniref:mini-chromosome maintenance complex-binding protein-like n=1 Tax=Ylistrum balloti TaxID=509963 RepID=UPI002905CD04|nr:mini-chromosome maintenance complex-binding protein-like [Ylistrum balloti]
MPVVDDWVNDPLGIIQNIYDKDGEVESGVVRDYFASRVKGNAMSWIPSLNDTPLHTLRPNSLVRYRCMIQDMYDPEFYLGSYEVVDTKTGKTNMKSGKYKDVAECASFQQINMESANNKTLDRQTLYGVPIPGESAWVKASFTDRAGVKAQPSTSYTPVRCKRSLEEDLSVESEAMETSDSTKVASSETTPVLESSENKRTCVSDRAAENSPVLPDLNFPLPEENGISCLIKVYDDIDAFCVNDMVEFIGVLSVDPSLAQFEAEDQGSESKVCADGFEVSMEEKNAHAPPPSLVPRLHAVLGMKLKHNNPLLTSSSPQEDGFKEVLARLQGEITTLRQHIIATLEHILFGDKLAAEYFLCHLLSSVYARADVMPLGKFCLNLTCCPTTPEYSALLHQFLSSIVTKSHHLPITIDNMNKIRLCPQKDYTANRLQSGALQLGADTSLILDETVLQAGQLDANGVKNMTALGNLINWQKVEYDFSYHRQEFMSDVAVLVLSEAKSLLPSDCLLPLAASIPAGVSLQDYFSRVDNLMSADFVNKFRTYLTAAKMLDYSMSGDIQTAIQDDFVNIRKDDPKNMTIDDFHKLLNLVRLLSISHLQSCPTQNLWTKVKAMETQRKQRLPQTSRNTN